MYQNYKIRINVPGILASIFLLIFFCAKIVEMPAIVSNGLIAGTGIICFVYCVAKQKISSNYFLLGIVLSISMFLSMLYNGNSSVVELLWIWCFLGVASILAYFQISSKTITGVFIVMSITFAVMIISGVNPQTALAFGSGNNISVYVLFYVMLIYIKRYEENKKIIFWPSILAILFSIWGNGRSGLLASILLFVLLFLHDFISKKRKISMLIRITVLLAIGWIVLQQYFGTYINTFLNKFDRYGMTSSRTELWAEYISVSFDSIGSFVFGPATKTNATPRLQNLGGNVHNAFLILHSNYGLFGFVFGIIATLKSLFTCLKHKYAIYVIVIVIWMFRSMFDWTGFPGIYDVLFLYMMMKANNTNKNKVEI